MLRTTLNPKTPAAADSIVREYIFDRGGKCAWFFRRALRDHKNMARNAVESSCWLFPHTTPPKLASLQLMNEGREDSMGD